VATLAALLITGLAGCGAGSAGTSTRHFSSLCVDTGLPTSGPQAGAGRAVLAGLRRIIPAAGLSVGGYRIRLCQSFDDAAAVIAHATAAAEDPRTIAYVGELSSADAQVAEAALGQAGIALVTPSGPASAPAPGVGVGVGVAGGFGVAGATRLTSPRSTALYLLPSARTQADAVAYARSQAGCDRTSGGRPTCLLIAPASAPLCTGITPSSADVARLCVLAGPDFYAWPSPAVAYGDSAGQLLLSTLMTIARRGGDVADRTTVLSALSRANLTTSPLGAIRFDAQGGMEADLFTAYTVRSDGGLMLAHLFRTH
jgi:hypothetical protein